jgi:hypothetical protein
LALNQDNVTDWSDMSTSRLLCQWASTVRIRIMWLIGVTCLLVDCCFSELALLELNLACWCSIKWTLLSLKCNLFSPLITHKYLCRHNLIYLINFESAIDIYFKKIVVVVRPFYCTLYHAIYWLVDWTLLMLCFFLNWPKWVFAVRSAVVSFAHFLL